MTEKLYDINAYDTEFTANVLSCEKCEDGRYAVVLDRTLFFPEEGGQTPDRGTLGGAEVLDVQIGKDGTITHYTNEALSNDVSGSIDFFHRFSNMQNHTGEHIFSGLVHSRFGYDNVGFHLSDNTVTMDYNGAFTDEDIRELEREANEVIFKNLPIRAWYPSEEELKSLDYRSKLDLTENVRIVEIEGVDLCACCAPHVKGTAEVGMLKVLYYMPHRGGTRFTILCGRRALFDYEEKQDTLLSISRGYSTSPDKLAEVLKKQQAELLDVKYALEKKIREALIREAKDLLQRIDKGDNIEKNIFSDVFDKKSLIIFSDDATESAARDTVNVMKEKTDEYIAIFMKQEDEKYRYVIGAKEKDAREIQKLLKERFDAKGGGKPEMIQGTVEV